MKNKIKEITGTLNVINLHELPIGKRKATPKNDGYFREAQGMYFNGKEIKQLSNIRRLA